MYRKLLCLVPCVLVLSLIGYAFAQEPEWDFYIPYAFEPPILDGQMDAVWSSVPVQEMTTPINGTVDSPLDLAGRWQVMWDSEYIYLIVEITDSELFNDSANNWRDDSIEFYFDGGNTKEEYAVAGALSGDNRQYNFPWNSDALMGTNADFTGVEHAQVDTPTGWRHEMRLPWMTLQGKEPQAGDLIGIDCFVNDDDDGGDTRETQLATFADDSGDWRNPADWGTAILVMGEGNIAYSPSPANGALHLNTWAQLTWKPGPSAVSHDVYIGDNLEEVDAGTGDTFKGNQATPTMLIGFPGYPYPDGLVPGTTYYWRVDEVNDAHPDSPWKGSIWSFSIPPRTAYNPDPADGAEFVALDSTLTWTPGHGAKLHTVYVGTDFDDVSNAAGGDSKGAASYKPASLDPEKVYYWRVDEFDGTETHKGDVWGFTTPGAAGNAQPANGAADVKITAILSWTPADNAASHDVYFGTDKDAVRNATAASPEYKGNKASGSESYNPGKLAWDSDYYWRVDAVYNTGTVKGLVWNFTTADFLLVDDFESYNDIDPPDASSNRIFDNWIDGFGTTTNGALVGNDLPPYAEQGVVHGGLQSMVYRYDNAGKTSEATLTLTWPRDWTEEAVTRLSLWFIGNSANSAERMYVALNGNAVIYNDDSAATQTGRWTQWVIDLQAFADQGVNLTNVNTITIGIGTKNSPAAGGTGTMYFDDIRLIR